MSYLQGFSKIMDESHAHVYRHKINKKLPSEPNAYLAYVSSFGSTGVRLGLIQPWHSQPYPTPHPGVH